ncbi:hypothetical protein GLYMA_09G266566v4 [Glycine max]|nr:hypothetical protein GLYMA_09G266566v4 [Glycine max]KAH1044978.1 hypothetical protein GYH30_026284 [Glycine max]
MPLVSANSVMLGRLVLMVLEHLSARWTSMVLIRFLSRFRNISDNRTPSKEVDFAKESFRPERSIIYVDKYRKLFFREQ